MIFQGLFRRLAIGQLSWLALWPSVAADPATPVGLQVAELKREAAVDFEKEILPIFRSNCLACHNTTKAKAGLNLETPQFILKGGDNGPAVVPGKSGDSLLFKAAAHLDPETIMPPKDNKANASELKPDQLALLKLWIEQGAKGEVLATAAIHWLEKPPVLEPILALDVTGDGQFTACSRGSRVDVYYVPSGERVARLTDPKLNSLGIPQAAHRDLVNAVAFHPDGTRLATAGYRDVKIWQRPAQWAERVVTNAGGLFAVSPDRQWIASRTMSNSIRLSRLATDAVVHKLEGHSNQIQALAFSPDNNLLASVSSDQTVRVWKIGDGSIVVTAAAPVSLNAVAWLSSQELAVAGGDGVIRVGALTNLSSPREWKGATGTITALSTSANGKELLSAGEDGVARLWDVAEAKIRLQLTQNVASAGAALRPDGKRAAVAGTNEVVKLWDLETGKSIADLKGDRRAYHAVADRDRGVVIAKGDVAFHKKAVETADAEMKKAEARITKATDTNNVTEKVYLEKEKVMKTAADAKGAAAKSLDELLAEIQRVTDAYEKADKAARESSVRATEAAARATETQLAADRATLSKADAERIATDTASVANRTKAAIANADAAKETARRIADESQGVAEKSRAFSEAVSADASMKLKLATDARLASNKAIEDVAALFFAAGQLKPNYDKTVGEAPAKRKQATNQVEATTKALVDAEKEFKRAETRKSVTNHELELATAGGLKASNVVARTKTTLTAAEGANRKAEEALESAKRQAASAEKPALALAFSLDGRILATVTKEGRVHTWSSETGAAFEVLTNDVAGSLDGPIGLAFLDRERLVSGNATGGAVSWNLNPPWTLERTIGSGEADSTFADRVNAVRFSPDGKFLATGGGEPTRSGEIKFFNLADGRLVKALSDVHSDAVLSIDYSPDGKLLASSSADRFVKVVDLATGKVVRAFEGHTSYVLGVTWKHDSRTLASAGADKVIKVWDFVTGDRRKNIEGAEKDVTGIAFVGVTDQFITTSGDSQVRLLKENGDKVRSFEGATDFMNSAAATPDGRVVVAGGQDGQLHIWNGTDGKKLASFPPAD